MARPWLQVGRYGSVGLEFIVTIFLLAALGHWLDRRYWHDAGWATAGGFLLGVTVGFRNLVRTANGMQKDIERAERMDPESSRWTVDESWTRRDDDVPGAERKDIKDFEDPPNHPEPGPGKRNHGPPS